VARLLAWCQFPAQPDAWGHATAEGCRQILPRIAQAAVMVDDLPAMFMTPLRRYLDGDPRMAELIDDDDRLLLMLSDLRDYLTLIGRGYR